MDVGIFLNSKKNILSWIIAPFLVSVVFYLFLFGYFKARENKLMEEKSLIDYIPLIDKKISAAEELLKKYNFKLTDSEVIEKLNLELRESARISSFSIDSMNIGKDPQASDGGSIFKTTVKGSGDLNSISNFVEALQVSGILLTIDSADIRLLGEAGARAYSADFIISYHSLQ